MADFFRNQSDYIFFCYGLAFILLVPITHFLNRRPQRRLSWGWLGLFGAAHGLNEWLDLLALDLGRGLTFDLIRLSLLIVSYIFLVEFGRAGTLTVRGRGFGRWVLAGLLGVALLGGLSGIPGLFATSRYALGLVGGLWAAGVLWLIATPDRPGQLFLRGTALGMAAYALASGLVVNPAPFFPASQLNSNSFLAATGLPIQLVRGLLAFWIAACLAGFGSACLVQETNRRIRRWSETLIFGAAAVLISLLIIGWLTTQYLGREAAQEIRTHQEGHAKLFSRSLRDRIQESDRITTALAASPEVTQALQNPSVQTIEHANLLLDSYSTIFTKAICYLMNRDGLTIASSNRHQADSFVGKSYEFRPYFQQAMQGTAGRYWALGVTTNELGFYASYPVRGRAGQIAGVAVFKRPIYEINELEELFHPESNGLVIDSHGIVILANRSTMVLKSLWPLSPATLEQLRASRQLGPGPIPPILTREPADRAEVWFDGQRQLILRQPLPWEGWSTVVLTPMRPIILNRLLGITLTLLFCLGVIGFLMVLGLTIEATARIQSSEMRYRGLYESLRDGSVAVNLEGKIIEWNPEFQNMLGYPAAELCELTYLDITPERWHPLEARLIEEQVFRRGYSNLFEKEYRRKDGTVLPVELQIYLVRDNQGHPIGMWGLVRDITERKRAEDRLSNGYNELHETAQQLEQSRKMLQLIIESVPLRVFWKDRDLRYVGCNTLFARDAGLSQPEELIGKDDFAMGWAEQAEIYRADDRQVMESRRPKVNIVEPQTTPTGGKIWLNTSKVPLQMPDGEVVGVLGVYEDITARKQAEEALRQSEEKYRLVFEKAPLGIMQYDQTGTITDCNQKFAEIIGAPKEQVIGFNMILQLRNDKMREAVAASLKGEVGYYEGDYLSVIGENLTSIRAIFQPIFSLEGVLSGGVSIFEDISERKLAEAAFQSLVSSAPIGIYIVQDGKFAMVNPGFEVITGYTAQELIGRHCLGPVNPEYRAFVREQALLRLKGEGLPPYEYQFITKNGETGWVMETVTPTQYQGKQAIMGYFMDITPLKKLEAQFLQSQKMEAVGRLAGGVAHDFNNMLGAIIGYAEMLTMHLSEDQRLCRYAEGIKKAADRAASLTRQLLAFSRKQVLQIQVLNLNEIITDLEKMLHRLIGEDIEMVTALDPALAPVKADKGQIEQIIMNLAVNARDAMPQGGKLTLETREVYLDETYCLEHPYVSPGAFVMLTVSDSGIGMDAATRDHIFEPFYTTKGTGKGTGLGLSTVYGIVQQSAGSIEVSSKPGLGTTFKIYLPAVEKPADEATGRDPCRGAARQ